MNRGYGESRSVVRLGIIFWNERMTQMSNAESYKRIYRAVVPAFLLAVSVGQIYAFTNFSTQIAEHIGETKSAVQFAFSLGIFFLGMGAAFFGKIVERNIRLSTIIGTTLFISGLLVTSLGINLKSLALIYLGYGFLVGTGTGIIYISPVKTMMLWFPNAKAIAAAVPIISFGLGSTLSTILYKGIHWGSEATFAMFHLRGFETYGITRTFAVFAAFYLPPMLVASFMLKKPKIEQMSFAHGLPQCEFTYMGLVKDSYFLRAWLFMFLNISSGLCLIPLAKQMMATEAVGYSEKLMTWVIALSGLMNGGGRFLFAWWSDRLARRVNILLFILGISAGVMMASWWPPLRGLLGDPGHPRRPLRHDQHLEDPWRGAFGLGRGGACRQPGGDSGERPPRLRQRRRDHDVGGALLAQLPQCAHALPS